MAFWLEADVSRTDEEGICTPLNFLQDDEDADQLEDALFENQLNPISLLEKMGEQATGSREAPDFQPYQVLTNTARQARAQHAGPSSQAKQSPAATKRKAEVCHLKSCSINLSC